MIRFNYRPHKFPAVMVLGALTLLALASSGRCDPITTRQGAIDKCLQLIRERRLPNGAFRMATRVPPGSNDVWIENYFDLEAMLAVLAATPNLQSQQSQDDVAMVAGYLGWYADNIQGPEGVAHNQEGTYDPFSVAPITVPGKDYDSIDSYAGLYLLVAARYYQLTGELPASAVQGCLDSLQALKRVIQEKQAVVGDQYDFINGAATNGLSIARADYPNHQLVDAVETHAGLRESVALFNALKGAAQPTQAGELETAATLAGQLASGMEKGVRLFVPTTEGRYPTLIDNGNNRYFDDRTSLYPDRLANLVAASYLPSRGAQNDAKTWTYLTENYAPDDSEGVPLAPSERWLIAALRVSPGDVPSLNAQVIENTNGFSDITYIDRMAITILALVDGAARYPEVRDMEAPSPSIAAPTENQNLSKATFTAITGSATDNVDVSQVLLKLFRVRSGATQYWNGSAFTSTSVLLSATVASPGSASTNWSYAVSPALKSALDSGGYEVFAYGKDTAGNQSAAVKRKFNLDLATPVPVITAPTAGQSLSLTSFNSITGSATDNVGVTGVLVKLFRTRNGALQYWNGSSFGPTQALLPATLASPGGPSTQWSYAVSPALKSALDSGAYGLHVYGQDGAGNQSAAVARSFTLDSSPPVPVISTPTAGQSLTVASFNSIAGSATDNIGVSQVLLKLFRVRGGVTQYWNGSAFTPTATLLPATVASPGSTSTNWSYGVSTALKTALDTGAYEVFAYGKDAAGNQSNAVSRKFSLTASAAAPARSAGDS